MGAAAEAACAVAGQAATVDPTARVEAVGAAMPESESAGVARTGAEVWGQRWELWSVDMRSYGANMAASRDGYQRDEEKAERDLDGAVPAQPGERE